MIRKNTERIRGLRLLLSALLCLALICSWAAAAGRTGSLRVTLTDDDELPVAGVAMVLCRVGESDGALTDDFSAAGISPSSLLSEQDKAENAKTLEDYAGKHGLTGAEQTTNTAGWVFYNGLTEGVYLVLCKPGQELTFTPFLVQMPTVINGAVLYNIRSDPKAEPSFDVGTEPSNPGVEPSDPDVEPGGTGTDVTPVLPQTGVNVWPVYILLVLGALLMILGIIDLWRSRRKRDE